MNEELVEKYYDKILGYSELFKDESKFVRKFEKNIKESLEVIIKKNRTHIFTESLLYYISKDPFIFDILATYASEDKQYIISFLKIYYERIMQVCKTDIKEDSIFSRLLDDDTKNIIKDSLNIIENINNSYDFFQYKSFFINMIYITLSYCHFYKGMDDFYYLYEYLFSNSNLIIEDMQINNVFDVNTLTLRTISILENINNKKMIK